MNMNIIEKLFTIQQKAVAPKDIDNNFGGFKYRNVEGILKNIKPVLQEMGVYCRLSDEAVELNGAVYIKATAALINAEDGEKIEATAYAREMESKKGMDSSQCTGSASTYARKYALQGLLGLDDSKAAPVIETDSQNPADHDEEQALSRQTILDQIYSLDVTRKELDDFIAKKRPGKDADTVSITDLRSIKAAIVQKRRNV
jgi:hypothetical protein